MSKTGIRKKGQELVGIKNCGWFGMIFENIQSDPPKEVRGQSRTWRSLQKHVKMTSNFILVEAKVDLRSHFKNVSKQLQITYLWMVWDDI